MIFGPEHVGDDNVSVEEVPIANAPLIALHVVVYAGFALALLPLDQGMTLVFASGLAVLLMASSIIDIKRFEIPDTLSVLLVVFGILDLWPASAELQLDRMVAGAGFPLLLWLVAIVFTAVRGYQGLGLGDVTLAAGIGLCVGVEGSIFVLLASSIAGIVVILTLGLLRRGTSEDSSISGVAFAPFLCLSTWVVWVQGAGV